MSLTGAVAESQIYNRMDDAGATQIVLTGQVDRIEELRARFGPAYPLFALPLLSVEFNVGEQELADIKGSFEESPLAIAVFSETGVRALAHALLTARIPWPDSARWLVVGPRTRQTVERLFPDTKILCESDDGTGAGLAQSFLATDFHPVRVIAIQAERGREEFYNLLSEQRIPCSRFHLYRTHARIPSPAELKALPPDAFVVLGSPSVARSFVSGLRSQPELIGRFKLCALGPTTATAITDEGFTVERVAGAMDYEAFVEELLATTSSDRTPGQ